MRSEEYPASFLAIALTDQKKNSYHHHREKIISQNFAEFPFEKFRFLKQFTFIFKENSKKKTSFETLEIFKRKIAETVKHR